MSNRGSICTEFIYCQKCFAAVKKILIDDNDPIWKLQQIKNQADGQLHPIIAGKYDGELWEFREYILPKLEDAICHPMWIAVLAEGGPEVFAVLPTDSASHSPQPPSSSLPPSSPVLP